MTAISERNPRAMDAGLKARIDLLRLLKLNPLPASGELVAPMRDVRVARDLRQSNRSNGSRLFADACVLIVDVSHDLPNVFLWEEVSKSRHHDDAVRDQVDHRFLVIRFAFFDQICWSNVG